MKHTNYSNNFYISAHKSKHGHNSITKQKKIYIYVNSQAFKNISQTTTTTTSKNIQRHHQQIKTKKYKQKKINNIEKNSFL